MEKIDNASNRRPLIGVILAALAASVCCIGPLVLLAVGVGGAWVGSLTALEPFRPYLMALTLAALGYAFYKIYRKPKAEHCEPGGYCANPKSDKINKILLWISTVFVLALLSVPYFLQFTSTESEQSVVGVVTNVSSVREIDLDVPGMSCPACPFTVQKSLTKLDGVIEAHAWLETKTARVKYDPAKVSIRQMIQATTDAGYPSKVKID